MNRIILFVVFLFFTLIFISCGNTQAPGNTDLSSLTVKDSVPKLDPGAVIEKITCSSDSRFSYALYLPDSFNQQENFPVIIFFDAHAKGKLPLEKYREIADESGFVLVGSNDSRNGIANALYAEIKKAIVDDVRQRIKIDERRIYLGGFSGGARVAINLALADPSVAGVIANSAGFEPSRAPLRSNLVIVGLAGNEDFNFLEQNRTEKSLQAYDFPHCMVEFDGKHDWAPAASMQRAFLFLDLAAKKDNIKVRNEARLRAAFEKDSMRLDSLRVKPRRFQQLQKIISFYSRITETKKYNEEFLKIKEDAAIKNWLAQREEDQLKESFLQSSYYQKVFSESPEWWEAEVKKMNAEKKGSEKYRMNKRLLSYLSLAVYMTLNSAEAKQDILQTEKFISIYSMVEPENPEWAYLKAVLRARQNNNKDALLYLQKANELGFDDKLRAMNQPEFQDLKQEPAFEKIIGNK
jgi:dienelactone hydrolase